MFINKISLKSKKAMKNQKKLFLTRIPLIAAAVVMVLAAPISTYAVDYNAQINELEKKIDSYQNEASRLSAQADSLSAVINRLNAQIASIQTQLELSQAKYDKLTAEINENEKRLALQKKAFADTLRDSYVDGTPSTIEIIASSNTIGEYIDKQEYRDSLNDQIQTTMAAIKTLRDKLAEQREEIERIIADQTAQRQDLASKRSEQADLLAVTRGKEENYKRLISQTQKQVEEKRAAQAAAMAAAGAGNGLAYGTSSYPWMGSSMAYNDYCQYYNGGGSAADPWGYCKRQCVSYVAWKLANDGRGNSGFSGLGHANGWGYGGNGVSVRDIRAGDVIVWYIGDYGHVMYVDYVSGETVGISQMNVPYDSGSFSTTTYTKSQLSSSQYEIRRFN